MKFAGSIVAFVALVAFVVTGVRDSNREFSDALVEDLEGTEHSFGTDTDTLEQRQAFNHSFVTGENKVGWEYSVDGGCPAGTSCWCRRGSRRSAAKWPSVQKLIDEGTFAPPANHKFTGKGIEFCKCSATNPDPSVPWFYGDFKWLRRSGDMATYKALTIDPNTYDMCFFPRQGLPCVEADFVNMNIQKGGALSEEKTLFDCARKWTDEALKLSSIEYEMNSDGMWQLKAHLQEDRAKGVWGCEFPLRDALGKTTGQCPVRPSHWKSRDIGLEIVAMTPAEVEDRDQKRLGADLANDAAANTECAPPSEKCCTELKPPAGKVSCYKSITQTCEVVAASIVSTFKNPVMGKCCKGFKEGEGTCTR